MEHSARFHAVYLYRDSSSHKTRTEAKPMNRENPVYDKPFVTKEPGNKLRISKSAYKAWLPMFYCIPKEIVQQRPIYLQLPRCPYEILRTDKYDKIVNDDAFLPSSLNS